MDGTSWSVLVGAGSVALVHTVLGPDHYLPFVALARARHWSTRRTLALTSICGAGHVLASLALGGLGVGLGLALSRAERLESVRGGIAAWALILFGAIYSAWGVRRALGHGEHRHETGQRTTTWSLFLIFVLGPCEPLIPLFVLPASRGDWFVAGLTATVFGAVTIGTMVALTSLQLIGLRRLRWARLEPWTHALAGAVIAASGAGVLLLGL